MAMLAIGANGLLPLQAMALEAIVDAVLITDADGLIVWANHALAGLTGFTADEAIGQTPRIFRSGRQDRRVYDELWATVRSGRVWRGRLLNRRKDCSVYSEEQTITPVTHEVERPTHFTALERTTDGQAHVP